jgi:hypothetical protein
MMPIHLDHPNTIDVSITLGCSCMRLVGRPGKGGGVHGTFQKASHRTGSGAQSQGWNTPHSAERIGVERAQDLDAAWANGWPCRFTCDAAGLSLLCHNLATTYADTSPCAVGDMAADGTG